MMPIKPSAFNLVSGCASLAKTGQFYAICQVFALCAPTDFMQFVYVCRDHALDRFKRPTVARDGDLDAIVRHALGGSGMQGYLIHVDEVLS